MTIAVDKSKPALNELPKNYLISLSQYSAIALQGEEQSKYLQGQVTCDLDLLTQNNLLNGAHCNAKGKVFSCFRLFNRAEQHLLFQHQATINASITELKKFGVFAKVAITTTDDLAFFALVGEQANELLIEHFGQAPDQLSPCIQVGSTTLVFIDGKTKRFLIIDNKSSLDSLLPNFNLTIFNNDVWQLLEIVEGFPTLANDSENEYVPQMLNMQAINGISFTKGCYLGQETVARMQYLGKNKKALFVLVGETCLQDSSLIIEKQLGENWRKAGDITTIYQADNQHCYIQAVLANDITPSTNLRIKNQPNSSLSTLELPYALNDEN